MPEATVAIPVRNGGEQFAGVLLALAEQTVAHELLVCDSGSSDGSADLARAHGARVIEIAPQEFSHGATRNRLMGEAHTERVALLTQDAQPTDEHWLERLLEGFELAGDVALVYGPYRPRADAPLPVRLELERWFASLADGWEPQLERLTDGERRLPVVELVGRRGFFTDANACIVRSAWERVPFREVAYAEDRVLAIDMLRAGYAKAYVPSAAVLHSHHYSAGEQLRRSFDEWRGLLEVYGWREPASARAQLSRLRGELGRSRTELVDEGLNGMGLLAALSAVARHHVLRSAGGLLGSHADRLPAGARRKLSLEGRAGFAPLKLDVPLPTPDQRPSP
ncbi:MAG TPA: glycosyltransferase family 2 protein [Solirubrobacteraceae bacterium]|jgi:rhamnosyltransferase|nr:glycosyltransferase family 2 protein [Solirubrobacteraceae bacterium]